MPTYSPIDEEATRRAKEMNSFYDYKPGGATEEYRQSVDHAAAIAETQKTRVNPTCTMRRSTVSWTSMPGSWRKP